jgi:large subunit ribosomal protein L29
MSKKQDLSKLNLEQLSTELATQSSRYSKMRFAHNITPSTNSSELRIARRDVARIATEIRKRELAK